MAKATDTKYEPKTKGAEPIAPFRLQDSGHMEWVRRYIPQPEQNGLYRQAIWITLAGNILLATGKGIAAYLSGSVALFADAANSISDVAYSILMVLGLWMAQRPPDRSHPQGHSRFEPLVGLMVTLSMTFAGYKAAEAAVQRFMAGGMAVQIGLPTLVLIAAALVKLGMFLSIRRIANKISSPTLRTAAVDNLSDVLTSTAAFFGILASNYLHPLFDPIAGLLVAGWIFRAAFLAGKENLGYLTGASASQELSDEIIQVAENVPGVIRVHHLMTEYVGPSLVIDLHVNVDGQTPLLETHRISDEIAEALESMPNVDRAYVHIEPDDWT